MNCRRHLLPLLLANALVALAQAPEGPSFEVASIKVSELPGGSSAFHGGPGTSSPGQWTATGVTVGYLVYLAWELAEYQLSGPPSINSEWFDIAAKVPPNTSKHDFHLMIQRLLKERIGLVLHHDSQVKELYEMVIAKGGSKLKPATPAAPGTVSVLTYDKNGIPQLTPGVTQGYILQVHGGMYILGRLQGMSNIARAFSSMIAAGRPVVDKTGLTGLYDYDVEYLPQFHSLDVDQSVTPGEFFPAAVERELGLKLEAKKGPVDIVVIDGFNKVPSDN